MFRRLLFLTALVGALAWTLTGAVAGGFIIGQFCMEGMQQSFGGPDERTLVADGMWVPIHVHYNQSTELRHSEHDLKSNPTPYIVLFSGAAPADVTLDTCKELVEKGKDHGVRVIIAGYASYVDLSAFVFSGVSDRIQINPAGLQIDFSVVDNGMLEVGGGTVDLAGLPATLVNVNRSLGTSSSVDGVFEVDAGDRRISGLNLALSDTAGFRVVLRPVLQQEKEAFRINLSNGETRVWSGSFQARQIQATGDRALIAGASILHPNIRADELQVRVLEGGVAIELSDLTGSATTVSYQGNPTTLSFSSPKFDAAVMTGGASQENSRWRVTRPALKNAHVSSAAGTLGSGGATFFEGKIGSQISAISDENLNANLLWMSPSSTVFSFIVPEGAIRETRLNVAGASNALTPTGATKVSRLNFGHSSLNEEVPISIPNTGITEEFKIPIKFAINDKKGKLELADKDQQIFLVAGLDTLSMDADLNIDIAHPAATELDIQPSGFLLSLSAVVSTRPFVAGTRPAFGDFQVGVANINQVTVAASKSIGTLEFETKTLTLGQPVVRIGQKGGEVRAAFELNSVGSAFIDYDIEKGRALIAAGTFEADDFEFKLLDPGAEIDLDGTLVRDPLEKISKLQIVLIKVEDTSVGTGQVDNIEINSSLVHKPFDPDHPTEITYSGTLLNPITISHVNALSVKIDKVLTFDFLELDGVAIAMSNIDVNFGEGAKVTDAQFGLVADKIEDFKLNDKEVQRFKAAGFAATGNLDPGNGVNLNGGTGVQFKVHVDGLSYALNGVGTAHVNPFTGSNQTGLEIKFSCASADHPDHLTVDSEFSFVSAGADLEVIYVDGRMSAEGGTGPLGVAVHSKSGNECDTQVSEHIVSPQGAWWTDGICSTGLQFYHCRWESPESSYSYHFKLRVVTLDGFITITKPRIRLDDKNNVHFCNIGVLDTSQFLVVGGVSPQIDGVQNFPGAQVAVNALLDAIFTAAESPIFTPAASGLGWMASSVIGTVGAMACIF